MINLLKKYWLSILVLIIIFIGCLMNTAPLPEPPPVMNFDKIVHSILFAGLAGVLFFDSTRYLRLSITKIRIFLLIFLFPVAIGGFIEIVQESKIFTKTRSGDWFDFLFDVLGALVGWGIALIINHWLPKRESKLKVLE